MGSAAAAGYYFGGKNTKGALIGLGAALVVLYVAKNAMGVTAALSGAPVNGSTDNEPVGPPVPVSTGNIPAPGTTSDPLGGVMEPTSVKRIGLLR